MKLAQAERKLEGLTKKSDFAKAAPRGWHGRFAPKNVKGHEEPIIVSWCVSTSATEAGYEAERECRYTEDRKAGKWVCGPPPGMSKKKIDEHVTRGQELERAIQEIDNEYLNTMVTIWDVASIALNQAKRFRNMTVERLTVEYAKDGGKEDEGR